MEFKNKKISIIGIARSGVAAAILLKKVGAKVFLSDFNNTSEENTLILKENSIKYESNSHSEEVYRADIAVVSPGVALNTKVIKKLYSLNIPVISEIEVAYQLSNSDIVAVTGSNGKSTTVTLIGELLKSGIFKSIVGGNIGNALCATCQDLSSGDVQVAEVSSFQLDSIVDFKPNVSVVLNLSPDHLDRYDSENDYYNSKLGISKNQDSQDLMIINADDKYTENWKIKSSLSVEFAEFSLKKEVKNGAFIKNNKVIFCNDTSEQEILDVNQIALLGFHNLYNVLASVIVAKKYGITNENIVKVLKTFTGIEHRMEFVKTKNDIKFYNDSKATNVDSVKWALQSFKSKVNLIAGGRDKDSDFSILNKVIEKHVKTVFAIGESKNKLFEEWNNVVPVVKEDSMETAVKDAYKNSYEDEIVLLSPACASFDMYKNYEERGKHFKMIVESL